VQYFKMDKLELIKWTSLCDSVLHKKYSIIPVSILDLKVNICNHGLQVPLYLVFSRTN